MSTRLLLPKLENSTDPLVHHLSKNLRDIHDYVSLCKRVVAIMENEILVVTTSKTAQRKHLKIRRVLESNNLLLTVFYLDFTKSVAYKYVASAKS